MDRYIECKTQEQWNIVVGHLNEKYNQTTKNRLDYISKWEKNYKEETVLHDEYDELWSYADRAFYCDKGIETFTSFEEFCKQEGINMEKKSTDYCFRGCKEFAEYLDYLIMKGDKRNKLTGISTCYYSKNEGSSYIGGFVYNAQTQPKDKILISWQEFKKQFIDKTMKTTQEEINELKAKLQELEDKVKEENEFKVGDIRVTLESLSYCEKDSTFCITKITGKNPKDRVYYSHLKDKDDYVTYKEILKYSRKATQTEIQKHLIAESERLGFKEGVRVKTPFGNIGTLTRLRDFVSFSTNVYGPDTTNSLRWYVKDPSADFVSLNIYSNEYGWSEIIKEKEIEISGYKAEFNKKDKTVSFGCKKDITIEDLKAILTVMKLNEQFENSFIIGEAYIDSMDNTDFSKEISKETIQKLIKGLE